MSQAWRWIDILEIRAIHDIQIARHGGLDGVRDQGMIESALARPRNLAVYGTPDAADLAASIVAQNKLAFLPVAWAD